MHCKFVPAAIFGLDKASGVEVSAVGLGMPFVFGEAGVIAEVDDGVFSLCEWYSAEGVSEADAAIENRQASENLGEPEWYVKSNLDDFPSGGLKATLRGLLFDIRVSGRILAPLPLAGLARLCRKLWFCVRGDLR